MFYNTILAIFLYLKSFISKLHEIYIVASQKFEEFGNECPHYTPSKALCSDQIMTEFDIFFIFLNCNKTYLKSDLGLVPEFLRVYKGIQMMVQSDAHFL